MKFHRLRTKIIVSFCLLMLSVGTVTILLVRGNLDASLMALTHQHGTALAQILAGQITDSMSFDDLVETKRLFLHARSSNPDVVYVFVTNPEGMVVSHSFPSDGFPADLMQVATRNGASILDTDLGAIQDIPAPIGNGSLGTVHLGMSLASANHATLAAMGNIMIATILALSMGVLLILVLASVISRPLYRLMDVTRRLGEGDLDAVAPVSGNDESAGLAVTFNRMAEQIRDRMAEIDGLRSYLERVLDNMGPGIVVVSDNGYVEYANQAIREEYGDIVGQPCREIFSAERPCWDCPAASSLQSGAVLRRRHVSASARFYELTYVPFFGRHGHISVIETAGDVTERSLLAERLQKAERLAVAGEIAAGVVHTINNPLDGVRRALNVAARGSQDGERMRSMLAIASEGVERIARVTQTLLNLARVRKTPSMSAVPVNTTIEEVLRLVRLKAADARITIHLDLDPALPLIEADPQGLNEVVMNLLLNAIDATPNDGQVTVSTRTVNATAIELTVADTGAGIPPSLRERIFEPFVSTKEVGRGTGLGLSLVKRIVDVHNGEINSESPPGMGATFRVRMPIHQPPPGRG